MAAHSPLSIILMRAEPAEDESAHQVYMGEDDGPFRCDHCTHYGPEERCNEPHIIERARKKQFGLRLDGKRAVVQPGGCSDYFNPSEEEEEDQSA